MGANARKGDVFMKVFLGLPLYASQIHPGTARVALTHATQGEVEYEYKFRTGSVLTWVFNRLWADALNSGADLFAMLHGDVVPEDYFLDRLHKILVEHDADVVSCVIPIKNPKGLTSTAVDDLDSPWNPRRLTMREVGKLPEVFSAADVYSNGWKGPNGGLLLNTGCWMCRLDRDWVRAGVEGTPYLRHSFTQEDGIFLDANGVAQVCTSSEDWNFSRALNAAGCKLLATRTIKINHFGEYGFPNQGEWGQEQDDSYFIEA